MAPAGIALLVIQLILIATLELGPLPKLRTIVADLDSELPPYLIRLVVLPWFFDLVSCAVLWVSLRGAMRLEHRAAQRRRVLVAAAAGLAGVATIMAGSFALISAAMLALHR